MLNDDLISKLIKTIEESNKRTIEEANKKQTEAIKHHIKQEIDQLKLEFEEELRTKTVEIENRYEKLKSKYEKLEKELRKNNIVIFGLQHNSGNLTEYVVNTLNTLLEINLTINDVDDVYKIGKSNNKPIILKLLSHLKKQQILKNSKKLKGTTVSVAEELTFEERRENKILRYHLKEARSRQLNAYIKNKKLVVSGQEYTVKELTGEDQSEKKEAVTENEIYESDHISDRRNNSAPATPVANNTQYSVHETEENRDEGVFEAEKIHQFRKIQGIKPNIQPIKKSRVTRANSTRESKNSNANEIVKTPVRK